MFKNKGFLYGLGLGLILGASLLYLMNAALIRATPPADNKPAVSASPQPSVSTKPTPSITPFKAIATPAPAATAATPAITQTANAVKPSAPATPAAHKETAANIHIEIVEGMVSSDVSKLLFDKGIIADQQQFEKSLDQLRLDRNIHYGRYTFATGQDINEIINAITTLK